MANVDFGHYKRIVQYFWDPEPKNDDPGKAPIWCLGRKFVQGTGEVNTLLPSNQQKNMILPEHSQDGATLSTLTKEPSREPRDAIENVSTLGEDNNGWPPDFLNDFESKLWFTYRSGFPPIKKSADPATSSAITLSVRLRNQFSDHGGFTTDTGWGCMIRSGQCLLANALGALRNSGDVRDRNRIDDQRHLIALFADDPRAPFSIHNFVEHGASACGKHPGEWFGPSATARCIQALSHKYVPNELKVYLTGDGSNVYEDALLRTAVADDGTFHPVLILVGIRLGIDRVTPVYWDSLKVALQLPQSLGIAGGRPSSSHYFIGVQGDSFFYLDPHQTRPAVPYREDDSEYTLEDIESYHTRRLRRLHLNDMDPSMLIAFLIRDKVDWRNWRVAINRYHGKAVVRVADTEHAFHGEGAERPGAVDEVESVEDEDDDNDIYEEEAIVLID